LPACGALIALAEIVRALPVETRSFAAGTSAVVAGLALITAGTEGAFKDARSFALAAVAGSPRCALAHVCLGRVYQGAGEDDRALDEYAAALALAPAEVVHNNVAVIEMKRAQWADAERDLGEELRVNPGYARAYLNLAVVLRHERRPVEACAAATRALVLSAEPSDGELRVEEERDCAEAPGR
jgi:Tfp pilus assembly protein PilF